jgi:hypothetical protein
MQLMQFSLLQVQETSEEPRMKPKSKVAQIDQERQRFASQLARVEELMKDGAPRSLAKIQSELKRLYRAHYLETSISARLRDLRRMGYQVERIKPRNTNSLFLYRAFKPEAN